MDTVKVLLGNQPRMLRETLRSAMAVQPGIEVEAVEPDPVELLTAVERSAADVVVITLPESGADPGVCSHLLTEYPDLLVIALSPVEASAVMYRLVITKEVLSPLSEQSLLAVIRGRCEDQQQVLSQRWEGR